MAINEPVEQFYIKPMPGMNNKYEDLDLKDQWVEEAQNCRFENEPGSVDKRDPVTYFNPTSMGAGGVVGLHRYYTSAGITKFVSVNGTNAYVGSDAGSSFTSIRTGLTDGKRCSFEVYKDLLYCGNGFDRIWVYDGASDNVTWEMGSCKAVAGSTAAGAVVAGDYIYSVTLGSGTAHTCDALSNTVTVAGGTNNTIELSNIPLGPVGTVQRRIYRTTVSGGTGTRALVHTMAENTAAAWSDTIADASLGAAFPSVNDEIPKGSILKMHRERLFITGDPTQPNRIGYSNVYLPHYTQPDTSGDYMDINPDDNDEIMGIPLQLGSMICIKKNTIRKLQVTQPQSGANPSSWYADDPISFIGSPAQWSIVQTPSGIIFLGWDHWYIFDGANVGPLMDEFDCLDILPAAYSDTVAFLHDGIFLAGYTDIESADQDHDRCMRYNFRRKALSYDTIPANCFTAKTGDDETGELYYGSSTAGFVLKDKNVDTAYRLNTKTMCLAGTTSGDDGVFVGGTESSPYLEIGTAASASAVPDDVCVFWDDTATTPGANWSEIDMDGRLAKIHTTAGTTNADDGHIHAYTGTLGMSTVSTISGGDSEGTCTASNHVHSITGDSDSVSLLPQHTRYRVFKSSSYTQTEFPTSSVVMWDQATDPEGWQSQIGNIGYYISGGTADLGETYTFDSTHAHTWTATSGAGGDCIDSGANSYAWDHPAHAPCDHTHNGSGLFDSVYTNDWELDRVETKLVKHIGDAGSWDGADKYVYALFDSTAAVSNGWTEESTTYLDHYIKVSSVAIATGSANTLGVHTHIVPSSTSIEGHNGNGPDYGGYHHNMIKAHTHPITISAADSTQTLTPLARTFRFIKKRLGHMKSYNLSITTSNTAGTWTSPSMEINAETLGKMYWNETKGDSDDVLLFTRSGSSQTVVENGTTCSANGGTDSFGANGHGLVNTDRVQIDADTTVPPGINNGIMYYAVGITGVDDFQVSLTSGGAAVDITGGGADVWFKKWDGPLTDPNGSDITSTANNWFQYRIDISAADTQVSNPRVSMANGYVVKFIYSQGATNAETSVPFRYHIGDRNFNSPSTTKKIKKIGTVHEGSAGSFDFIWTSDQTTNSFTVDLSTNQETWDSFAQDTAIGKTFDFEIYKNDNNPFRLSEVRGVFSSYPEIV